MTGLEASERFATASQPALPESRTCGSLPTARQRALVVAPSNSLPVRVVLVASVKRTTSLYSGDGPLTALSSERAKYVVIQRPSCKVENLERLLQEHAPRLLVIDVEICALLNHTSLGRRHRAQAGLDWLISWNEPSPRWIHLLTEARALGCVPRTASVADFKRALDAVLSGDVWFPRSVMSWLYICQLSKAQHEARFGPAGGQEIRDVTLTAREAQTLALMSRGLTNKQIAERLDISINTVKTHVASAFEKRGLHCRRQVLC